MYVHKLGYRFVHNKHKKKFIHLFTIGSGILMSGFESRNLLLVERIYVTIQPGGSRTS